MLKSIFDKPMQNQPIYLHFGKYSQHSPSRTISRKRPPPVRDRFVNNRFVFQSNTVSKILS